MTQEPQQPFANEPQPLPEQPPVQPPAQPPVQPPAQPPVQPQWGQYAPQQPYQGQPPAQPQWGQYSPQQPYQGQPPAQPQWGQYPPQQQYPGQGYAQPGYPQYVAPPKPGVIPLRPLNVGEVLDGAFQAARRNGKAMFGSALIFQLVSAALVFVVTALLFGQLGVSLMNGSLANSEPSNAEISALLMTMVQYFGILTILGFVTILAQVVLEGALAVPVLRAVLNRKTSFTDMWRLARPRIGTLLLLALLYSAATLLAVALYAGIVIAISFGVGNLSQAGNVFAVVGLALLLSLPFLVVGVWLGTKLLVAPSAIIVENVGVWAAIRRSWQLTGGNWWRTFGITLLATVIAGVIGSVISMPLGFASGLIGEMSMSTPEQIMSTTLIVQGVGSLLGALVGAVTLAFQSGVTALLYVDLRMRRDGFDISLLAEAELGKDDGGIPGRAHPAAAAAGQGNNNGYPGA